MVENLWLVYSYSGRLAAKRDWHSPSLLTDNSPAPVPAERCLSYSACNLRISSDALSVAGKIRDMNPRSANYVPFASAFTSPGSTLTVDPSLRSGSCLTSALCAPIDRLQASYCASTSGDGSLFSPCPTEHRYI